MNLDLAIQTQFPHAANLIYLNHAAVAPWPQCAHDALLRFADENVTVGALHYPRWLQTERELRAMLCRLINAESADCIALLKNTSEALSVIAYGLDWKPGDNIVLSSHEFPSNRVVWESLQRYGVETRVVEFPDYTDPESVLLSAVDRNTRLLTSSSVHYASGLRMNLERLGEACKRRDILFCVDAIQSLGALPFDAQAVHADFVAADGHKWLLGAEGLAVFYCAPRHMERLKLHQFGWHMLQQAGDYSRSDWQPAKTAQRFECGSPNMPGIHILHASIGLLLDCGMDSVSRNIINNVSYLIDKFKDIQRTKIISPLPAERRSGILTVHAENCDVAALHQYLLAHNVVCAQRGGGIRLSPHFYNHESQLQQAVTIFQEGLQQLK
jgi:cysteine desulfurase/selenocysteine lyase